ncbi:MAG: hypothetical protein M0C28_00685 [Candidatus Moduliflexus flocculans]|nr:hypothetical protein [Candidatus Moduliflexus flocculans]
MAVVSLRAQQAPHLPDPARHHHRRPDHHRRRLGHPGPQQLRLHQDGLLRGQRLLGPEVLDDRHVPQGLPRAAQAQGPDPGRARPHPGQLPVVRARRGQHLDQPDGQVRQPVPQGHRGPRRDRTSTTRSARSSSSTSRPPPPEHGRDQLAARRRHRLRRRREGLRRPRPGRPLAQGRQPELPGRRRRQGQGQDPGLQPGQLRPHPHHDLHEGLRLAPLHQHQHPHRLPGSHGPGPGGGPDRPRGPGGSAPTTMPDDFSFATSETFIQFYKTATSGIYFAMIAVVLDRPRSSAASSS